MQRMHETTPTPTEIPENGLPFSDQDFNTALRRAFRMVALLAVLGVPATWLVAGRSSAILFAVGAVIAATSILVWQRLMGAILERMAQGRKQRPAGPVLLWFFTHLLLSGCLLYVSLSSSNGSVYALVAGLGLAIFALVIESFRLSKVLTL